jgi:hypothetical protein
MTLPRRTFLQFTGAAIAAPAFSKVARAQTYPTRPITMIVPIGAGTSADVVGRVVTERMGKSLGQESAPAKLGCAADDTNPPARGCPGKVTQRPAAHETLLREFAARSEQVSFPLESISWVVTSLSSSSRTMHPCAPGAGGDDRVGRSAPRTWMPCVRGRHSNNNTKAGLGGGCRCRACVRPHPAIRMEKTRETKFCPVASPGGGGRSRYRVDSRRSRRRHLRRRRDLPLSDLRQMGGRL